MKTTTTAGIIIGIIIAIILGLIAYSYTQIHISLDSMSFEGFVWDLSGLSIIKAGISLLSGNLLGTILSVITGIKLNLIFGLTNNGIFPVYIPDLTYDLFVNDIDLGQGHSSVDLTINPGETKQLPILENFQFSTLGPAAESVIASNGIMEIKVSGTAYFKFLGLSVPVPFESTKQVSVVDEAEKYINEKLSGQTTNSYQPPSVSTNISLQASSYSVTEGQSITFSGQLVDSNGNGISNQLIYVKRDISLASDSILGTAYTDTNGYFSINWISTKPLTSNMANVYATFDGSQGYSGVRGSDISIQVGSYQVTQPSTQGSPSLEQQLQIARQKIQSIQSNPNSQVPSFSVANSVYQVKPHTYTYIQFNIQCSGTLTGKFSAQAALGNNIIVYVMDSTGFRQFQSGGSASTYYNSGKVASGTLNIGLPSGQYYLILSNLYSTISTKNVSLVASYSCS
ncbi:MAG: LEA type 2 family protein [Nitrosotalea sp.]